MPTPPPVPTPDGWDFDPEFLGDPRHLPPYVASHDTPLLGPSRRPTADDLATAFRAPNDPPRAGALELPGVWPIVDDRRAGRYRLPGARALLLPETLLQRHLLLVGPPGVGKTSQGVLPLTSTLLADPQRSVVVFDPKGDQAGTIRAIARRAGRSARSIVRLNLTDPAGSIGWNPLRPGLSRTEAHGIADALVMAAEARSTNDSPFWRNKSIELIAEMLLGLAADPDERLTLPRLAEVLALPRRELMQWLRAHGVNRFGAFLESGSHNAETCLGDANMRLLSLLDLDLCAVLSHGELRLERLFERPMVLVVEMDETRIGRLRPVFDLLVQQILDRGIAAASRYADARLRFPVSLVVDEFGSAIGAIPRFPTTLNTLRSRRIGVIAAVQSIAQIHALYGSEAESVLTGFGSKVFFPGATPLDADYASRLAGTMTVQLPGESGAPGPWVARPVWLPEEIARPRAHPVLGRPVTLLLAELAPMQAYLTPGYRRPDLAPVLRTAQRRTMRPRRRRPLIYTPGHPGADRRRPFTELRGLAAAAVRDLLAAAERRLGLPAAPAELQRLWQRWRSGPLDDVALALRFLEECEHRGVAAAGLPGVLRECGSDSPTVALKYLDYLQARRQHDDGPPLPF